LQSGSEASGEGGVSLFGIKKEKINKKNFLKFLFVLKNVNL
jgi:hypothetical protein